jgi:hypothetical protein
LVAKAVTRQKLLFKNASGRRISGGYWVKIQADENSIRKVFDLQMKDRTKANAFINGVCADICQTKFIARNCWQFDMETPSRTWKDPGIPKLIDTC